MIPKEKTKLFVFVIAALGFLVLAFPKLGILERLSAQAEIEHGLLTPLLYYKITQTISAIQLLVYIGLIIYFVRSRKKGKPAYKGLGILLLVQLIKPIVLISFLNLNASFESAESKTSTCSIFIKNESQLSVGFDRCTDFEVATAKLTAEQFAGLQLNEMVRITARQGRWLERTFEAQ